MTRDEVIEVCTVNGVPAGAINSIEDIFNDPHFKERGTMTSVNVPGIGDVIVPAALPRLSETPGEVKTLGPTLGEANDMVYGDWLNLSQDEREQLTTDGVI